jgi:hypothetical protein
VGGVWCLGFEDDSGGITGVFDLWDADAHVLLLGLAVY